MVMRQEVTFLKERDVSCYQEQRGHTVTVTTVDV